MSVSTTNTGPMLYPRFPITAYWGDGAGSTTASSDALLYTYARSGTYTVRAEDNAGRVGYTSITVVMPPVITGYRPAPLTATTTSNYVSVFLVGENFIPGIQFSLDGEQTWLSSVYRESDQSIRITVSKTVFLDMIRTLSSPVGTGTSQQYLGIALRVPKFTNDGWVYSDYSGNVEYRIPVESVRNGAFSDQFSDDFDNVASAVTAVPQSSAQVPVALSSAELNAWIGTDIVRAEQALATEAASGHPRSPVVSYATAVIRGH